MDFFDFFRWDIIWNYRELYAKGLWATIVLTACGYIGGIIFGLVLGLGQVSTKSGFTGRRKSMSTYSVVRQCSYNYY